MFSIRCSLSRPVLPVGLLLTLSLAAHLSAQTPLTILLEQDGFETVLDEARNQLYVSVPDANEIIVISLETGAITTLFVGAKPMGIDLSLSGELLFAALGTTGEVAYLDLDTLSVTSVDVLAELGSNKTYDVIEGKPNRLFVSANAEGSGLSYAAMIKRDQGNAAVRVAGTPTEPTGIVLRARPVFERSLDQTALYIGETAFSPNSLYKLDITTDAAPLVLEDVHGSVSRTNHLASSPDGRIFLGSGQVLRTSDFVEVATVTGGIPRLNAAGDLVYIARGRTPFFDSQVDVEVFETSGFTKVGQTIELPCTYSLLRDFELLDDGEGFFVLGEKGFRGEDSICGSLPVRAHDVSISLVDAPDPAVYGQNVSYTGTVENVGSQSVTGVEATLTLPQGMSFVSSSGAPCLEAGGVVSCSLGSMMPGAAVPFTVVATAIYTGELTATASVAIDEGDEIPFTNIAHETTSVTAGGCDELVHDGSFEAGSPNPFWGEFSLNFGTPLCTSSICGLGGGTTGPRSGGVWAWFGGVSGRVEAGSLSQNVVLPPGGTALHFHFWSGANSGNGRDFFMASIDGNPLFVTVEGNPSYASSYQLVTVDISGYADGGSHLISFDSNTFGPSTTNFSLDDVSIQSCPPPILSVGPDSAAEGDEGTSVVTFDLMLSAPSPVPVSVPFSTLDGSAQADSDYLGASGSLVIPPGTTDTTIAISILGDYAFEADETLTVQLGSPTGAILMAPPFATGTILNDDSPGLTVGDVTVTEPETGAVAATFKVELWPPETSTVTVDYATLDGTATEANGDYTAASGSLIFVPGTTVQTFDVPVLADADPEGPESFSVELSLSSGPAIARSVASGYIVPPGFFTLDPCRLIDTRQAVSHFNGPALQAGADRVFHVAGKCGIPVSATAVSVNIAVTGSTAPGNVRLHPGGSTVPPTSSINFAAGQTRSNNAIVPLDELGRLAAFLAQATGTAHLILDVNGYFQ